MNKIDAGVLMLSIVIVGYFMILFIAWIVKRFEKKQGDIVPKDVSQLFVTRKQIDSAKKIMERK